MYCNIFSWTVFFTDLLSDKAFGSKRIVLGVVFLAYAIYRSYRMYSAYKQKEQ